MKRLAKKAAHGRCSRRASRQAGGHRALQQPGQLSRQRPSSVPADDDQKAALALEIDPAMREQAPAGWKGDETREKQVLNALFPLMSRDREATQALFEIIKNQPGY